MFAKLHKCRDLIYFGAPDNKALQADVLFIGSWTDRGTCCVPISQFLQSLKDKRVYIFGTAGFGGESAYFAQIANNMAKNLSDDNTLLGYYLCQGKMPQSVREKYETMAQADPQKFAPMLKNFDLALSHPNQQDLDELKQKALALIQALPAK